MIRSNRNAQKKTSKSNDPEANLTFPRWQSGAMASAGSLSLQTSSIRAPCPRVKKWGLAQFLAFRCRMVSPYVHLHDSCALIQGDAEDGKRWQHAQWTIDRSAEQARQVKSSPAG